MDKFGPVRDQVHFLSLRDALKASDLRFRKLQGSGFGLRGLETLRFRVWASRFGNSTDPDPDPDLDPDPDSDPWSGSGSGSVIQIRGTDPDPVQGLGSKV